MWSLRTALGRRMHARKSACHMRHAVRAKSLLLLNDGSRTSSATSGSTYSNARGPPNCIAHTWQRTAHLVLINLPPASRALDDSNNTQSDHGVDKHRSQLSINISQAVRTCACVTAPISNAHMPGTCMRAAQVACSGLHVLCMLKCSLHWAVRCAYIS
jgi:hypothetical protein